MTTYAAHLGSQRLHRHPRNHRVALTWILLQAYDPVQRARSAWKRSTTRGLGTRATSGAGRETGISTRATTARVMRRIAKLTSENRTSARHTVTIIRATRTVTSFARSARRDARSATRLTSMRLRGVRLTPSEAGTSPARRASPRRPCSAAPPSATSLSLYIAQHALRRSTDERWTVSSLVSLVARLTRLASVARARPRRLGGASVFVFAFYYSAFTAPDAVSIR